MRIFVLNLLLLLSDFIFVTHINGQSYVENKFPYRLMGTRTAYASARGTSLRSSIDSSCKPVQIWALIRHGTRYPDAQVITKFSQLNSIRDQILLNHKKKGQLCAIDLENLRKWQLNSNPQNMPAKYLTETGKTEMREFAKRLKDSYPELLHVKNPEAVSQRDFKFRSTDEQRTTASMHAFMEGLFDGKKVKSDVPPKIDSLLYTYKNCPAYEESLIIDPIVESETIKFTNGPNVLAVLQKVSKRLGFDKLIDTESMLLIYEICRFETAWYGRSAWCAAFDAADIKVLEYREDIGCYYYCGPGRRINELLGCPPLQDMIGRFRNVKNNIAEPKAVFYFSHTVTIQATMAAMGIGKDSYPLLASNYHEATNRTFKTSLISPFSGNLVAVLHRCDGNKVTRHKVTVHVSERFWSIPGCPNNVCDWENFEKKYAQAADQCNLDFCEKRKN